MRQLKLDYDEEDWLQLFDRRRSMVEGILKIEIKNVRIYRSKNGNMHVRAWVPDVPDLALCALQAILGSDPARECFNLRRILKGVKNWNVLFNLDERRIA